MKLRFKLIHASATVPVYASKHAAGMDLTAVEPVTIPAGERRLVKTGLVSEFEPGYELQIRSRSGLALKHGVFVLNSPGTIDADYRGEIGVILQNSGTASFEIKPGDRVAQMVPARLEPVDIGIVSSVTETERGAGGFGSTS